MPSMRRSNAASTHEKGDRKYARSSRLKMMLVARISASNKSNERALELATGVVELDQIELRVDDSAADFRAAVFRRREREQQAATLLVRIRDVLHAVDAAEH